MMDFNEGLGVDRVGEAGQLVHLGVDVLLYLSQELFIAMRISSKGVSNLFSDIEISDGSSTLELPEHDGLIRLRNYQLLLVFQLGLLRDPGTTLQALLVDSSTLIGQDLEHTVDRTQQLGIRENLQAHLHPLSVVGVNVFLLSLQERANDE